MAEWTHIIIDEVHERDKDMDFLLLLSRKFLTSNSQGVKIILMSATLDQRKLRSYYTWPMYENGPPEEQASYFEITGSLSHKVTVFYLDDIPHLRRSSFDNMEGKPVLNEQCVIECRKIIFDGIQKVDNG